MRRAAHSVLIGQLVFYAGLAVCVLLKPTGLAANDGISYYGIYRETFFPYAIGLLGAAYFTVRAVSQLDPAEKVLRTALKTYAPLVAGIVITPYAADWVTNYLHTACGSALFFLQLLLGGWLTWRSHYAWWSVTLTLTMIVAGIASAVYLTSAHGFLLQTQFIFQIAFGTLLSLSLRRLPAPEGATSQPM